MKIVSKNINQLCREVDTEGNKSMRLFRNEIEESPKHLEPETEAIIYGHDNSCVRVHRFRAINDCCSRCRKEDGRKRRQIKKH